MATLIFLITSVISLFFSLIFSTKFFQQKQSLHFFISISLFFFFLASVSLCVGQLFVWYQWLVVLFYLSYTFVFLILLYIPLNQLLKPLIGSKQKEWLLGFTLPLASLFLLFFLALLNRDLSQLSTTQLVLDFRWLKQELNSFYTMLRIGFMAMVLVSLAVWWREKRKYWLWLTFSSFLFFCLDLLVGKGLLGLFSFSIFWLVILVVLVLAYLPELNSQATGQSEKKKK